MSSVRYIRVTPSSDMFTPAVRAYGNVAIIGTVTPEGAAPADMVVAGEVVPFADPSEARRRAPGTLGRSVALALKQSPGPAVVYAVRVDGNPVDWAAGFKAIESESVQLVTVAGTPLDATTGQNTGPIGLLAAHVSADAPDGLERMGVAMLEDGATDTTVLTTSLAKDRMVYVAHRSAQDAAAAVAGTIAGYEPHVSMLLKPVDIDSKPLPATDILALNGVETPNGPPAGKGVVWLAHPPLIPGRGCYLGEGYTGDPGSTKKYIDIVRCLDDVSYRLKARLIRTIGNLRISRSGLRALVAQLEAVLEPLVRAEVIEGYTVVVPILALLDKEERTPEEQAEVDDAQAQRLVEVLASVDYAGAIHRLNIKLNFH
ncbi:hypothetical protein [Spirillospora sp. NPDC029432]|uniref:hypothetical protein n=1 Tax=Spirillospora sp. NPDC029432 TaxID=3154599 RepID=UPI003456EA8E